ncbi:ABC transporter ATP-binding protein [Aeromicrobium ginsengisoli]|uniref:ABC transporter ATP-binding protein n=1 Tax=Aeromicrobium ginsengisoli TaxID=363867 RepID=A0A5M4FGL3_9ACTN|nr:ABC transporter ATP-binding protein [Aeromicrobium ginsengisoli]KAA1398021.1 ABC transporter ATP-binding protein [Aeromicrobium ginsengisoli]
MNSSTPAVSIDGVVKRFGSVTAVDGLSLQIQPGEVVAFLGPNGAGKTTTVDMILGLSQPSEGSVQIFGGDARQAVALGRVAAVMQTGGLLKDFTVRETVELTASLFIPSRPVDEVLDRAGILDIGDRLVGKASGGQQQRLRFALALLSDPDLLILDEPTTGMDVQGRREFWHAIRSDAADGRTTVFATHYLEEADAYADRIVLVRKGKIVADGTAAEIKALSAGRTVRATLDQADTSALARIAGVDSVDVRGDSVLIHGSDSDEIARYLLNHTPARDLEITSRNLEDAFIALTGDDAQTPEGALA